MHPSDGRRSGLRSLWALVARNRDYRLLLSAGLISLTGDAVMLVGLTYLVYALTGSTLASGLTLLATLVPQITLGSVAGVFVDRWDRRRTMITTNLLLGAGLMPLLLVHTGSQVWIVYVVALWESAVAQMFGPAEAALVPALVSDTDLVAANALNVQNRDIARLVGAALGGIVATWGGITAIAVADAATFVTAAVLLASIRSQVVRVTQARRRLTAQIRAVRTEWADGLRIATGAPILRTVLWCVLIAGVGEGAFGTLIAPWFHDVLHRDSTAYGLILSVQAIGGIAGGLATAAIGHRYAAHVLLGWGLVTFGAIDFTLFAYPLVRAVVWPAVILIAIVGTPAAVSSAGLMTVVQRETLDASRGRVIGAVLAVSGAGMLLGVGIAASLPRWVGILPVLAVAAGVGPAAAGVLVLARTARQRRVVAVAVGQ